MKLVPLTDIFNIRYGNQFDFSKMDVCSMPNDKSIAFVGRSAVNHGVGAHVYEFEDVEPFNAGLITVAMGGSMLASFVQNQDFYTAQNIKVLTPKTELSINEKLYYCAAIESNRFRYSTFGREANSTFNSIKVPAIESIPNEVSSMRTAQIKKESALIEKLSLNTKKWTFFKYSDLFNIATSKDDNLVDAISGETAFISSTRFQNGISQWVDADASQEANTISVARNGSVGSAFYHDYEYVASPDDVRIFTPKFKMNAYIAIFLITLIEKEKYRYAYGRKFGSKRMQNSVMKLPTDTNGQPDWGFIECYIKSLPYSSNL